MFTPMTTSGQPKQRKPQALSTSGGESSESSLPIAKEPHIGTLNEGSLHASLKRIYAEPGDQFEVPMEGFVIDIVRAAGQRNELLIEIQTGSFGAMGNKMDRLLTERKMLLVHPIAVRSTLHKPGARPRKSPKQGNVYSVFDELVSIPTLLDHPNLELELVLVNVSKKQIHDPKARRGRGGFRTVDRSLDAIIHTERFSTIDDLLRLMPEALPEIFTTADLVAGGCPSRDAAQKLAYCFKAAGLIDQVDRTRAGIHYRLSDRGPG